MTDQISTQSPLSVGETFLVDESTAAARHLTMAELDAGLDEIRQSPPTNGTLLMIVSRPEVETRVIQAVGELDPEQGLVGDNWQSRGSSRTEDGSAHPEMQITLMNTRVVQLVSQAQARWALAGDQLFVDLDLSVDNLPPGQRLAIGSAILEITPMAHTGCQKFSNRFGVDALKWVNSKDGKELRLRGIYARVIQGGTIREGDVIRRL
jgi:hypothetical protein